MGAMQQALLAGAAAAAGVVAVVTSTQVITTATTTPSFSTTGGAGTYAVAICARAGGPSRTIASVTIGGVTAAPQVQVDGGGGTTTRAEIWTASGVPANPTITATVGGTVSACTWEMTSYLLQGVSSATKTHSNTTSGTGPLTTSMSANAGGTLIAVCCAERGAGATVFAWSGAAGVVEDHDAVMDGPNGASGSTAHKDTAVAISAQAVTVTFSSSPVNTAGLAAAAFL